MTASPDEVRRLKTAMFVVTGLAAFVAMVSAVAAFAFDQPWGLPSLVVALAIGFGSQLWFITSVIKGGKS